MHTSTLQLDRKKEGEVESDEGDERDLPSPSQTPDRPSQRPSMKPDYERCNVQHAYDISTCLAQYIKTQRSVTTLTQNKHETSAVLDK